MPRKIPIATKMVNKIAQKKANPSKLAVATTKALGKGLGKAVGASTPSAKPKPNVLTLRKVIKHQRDNAAFFKDLNKKEKSK